MIVVGSKALQVYIPVNRVIHDLDLWMTTKEFYMFLHEYQPYIVKKTPGSTIFDIKGEIVEVKTQDQFEPTDLKIWNNTLSQINPKTLKTTYGECLVPTSQDLYVMKAATAAHIPEWKHEFDLKQMYQKLDILIPACGDLYEERWKETKERVEASKKDLHSFFHRNSYMQQKLATIPEYIQHDRLHELITDLLGKEIPTYLRITDGNYRVNIESFHKLSHDQKIDLMVEESLVLALERWFIPQMVENGIRYHLISRFFSNNEASPSYRLLVHTCIKGLKGEEPDIVEFARSHFNEIERRWIGYKAKILSVGGFPDWFIDELVDLRERYKKGEKVGLHHDRN